MNLGDTIQPIRYLLTQIAYSESETHQAESSGHVSDMLHKNISSLEIQRRQSLEFGSHQKEGYLVNRKREKKERERL